MLVPRIIKMISHMYTCQLEWKKLSESKRNQALAVTEENISEAFDFTFDKNSNKIDPKVTKLSQINFFIQHDMFQALVSELI